jgi:hypothetical protein
MKHLIKYNEHILFPDEKEYHFFNKVSLLTSSDLDLDELYKYRRKIESGEGKGNTLSAIVKFIKSDNNKYHFRVIKVLTPNLARLLNFKVDDIIISDSSEISKYYTIK